MSSASFNISLISPVIKSKGHSNDYRSGVLKYFLNMFVIMPYKFMFGIVIMKFFKNSLIIHDFFRELNAGTAAETYAKKVWPLIKADFDLSKRISRINTIINKIKDMDDAQQLITEKMTADKETLKSVEDVPGMDEDELKKEIRRENLITSYDSVEQLRDRLRKFYENTLAWEEYKVGRLIKELQLRELTVPKWYSSLHRHSRRDQNNFKYIACKVLDNYEEGNLPPREFSTENAFDVYVDKWLGEYNLSTSGSQSEKRKKYYQHVLNKWKLNVLGDTGQLVDRMYRYINSDVKSNDLSLEGVKKQLEKHRLVVDGDFHELVGRLDRFRYRKNVPEDYTTDWLQDALKKNNLSTEGERVDLLTRLEIVRLRRENEKLRKELAECNIAKGRHRRKAYNSSREKKNSGGMGFYSGAVLGAMVGSVVCREQSKTNLIF